MLVTYTKLRNGYWGLRGMNLKSGDVVTVTTRAGKTKTETVAKVYWTGPDGLTIASKRYVPRARYAERAEPRTSGFGYAGRPVSPADADAAAEWAVDAAMAEAANRY